MRRHCRFKNGDLEIKQSNLDVFPTEETRKLYAGIRSLLDNPTIDGAFTKFERRAVQSKSSFHFLGRLAISLIAISAVYAIADALIIPEFESKIWLNVFLGLGAACGIGLQIYLLITNKKAAWLLNRFAAERLRSLKFQAFAFADIAKDEKELSELVATFSEKETAKLENELNAGFSTLDTFRPSVSLAIPKSQGKPINVELNEQAFDAYQELRVNYQLRFAASEIHRLKSGQRYIASFSDILFLAGASLVLASLALKVFATSADTAGAWVDFLASAIFISAIASAILDHGGLSSRSESRFVDYRAAIQEFPKAYPSRTGILGLIRKMEFAALEELRSFSESSKMISYRV